MPIYEYQCGFCANVESRIKPLSRKNEVESCSRCQSDLTRIPAVPGNPVFRGSGFHATDYRKGEK